MAEPTPIKTLLVAELEAIAKRLVKASSDEGKRLEAQFGERVRHLKDRIEAAVDPAPDDPPKDKPADAPKAG